MRAPEASAAVSLGGPAWEGLLAGEVHLWLLVDRSEIGPELCERYGALLDPSETERWGRYVFERGRREYLLTRALVRTVLSRYSPTRPADWVFVANEFGAPELPGEAGRRLRFNLSNTDGLIACAVAAQREVGVDVEARDRRGVLPEVADRYLSAQELSDLRALPAAAQPERFLTYWTLKEAYIKARRMGLALPLERFTFLLGEGRPDRLVLDPRLGDDADRWLIHRATPTPRHLLALVAERGVAAGPLRLVSREVTPLAEEAAG